MNKKFYEGSNGTLVVEANGKLYPFLISCHTRSSNGSYREAFKDDDMDGYGKVPWWLLKMNGETFVEVEQCK